jgi:pentatricopeptide repeat protein
MQAVWDIFHQMVAREIAPNELTYEILIKRHCAASNLEHALQAMVDLDSRGLGATLGSTQAVISLACELEQPRLALDIADAFTSNSVRRLVSDDWLKILTACAKDLWVRLFYFTLFFS